MKYPHAQIFQQTTIFINVCELITKSIYSFFLQEEKEKFKQHQHRSNLQIEGLERRLKEETERHSFTQSKLDNVNTKVKGELEKQIKHLKDAENSLKEENTNLLTELSEVKGECESQSRKLREKEREYQQTVEKEVKAAEAKLKTRIEKTWVEKLKRSEESAAQDVSIDVISPCENYYHFYFRLNTV